MTTTTASRFTALMALIDAFAPDEPGACAVCLRYARERLHAVLPHLVDQARLVDPDADRSDWLEAGTTVANLLETYLAKVHIRHLSGQPLDTPESTTTFDLVDVLEWHPAIHPAEHTAPAVDLGPPPRPCRRCRLRGRKKKARRQHAHVQPIGEVQ